ncbi:MAG: hypothetical protein OEY01_10045 [Desulfobulbaceae bacterium]|nr:hypothetical protein [Desulfobulbaceae bacterium]HIJ79314.1 hypothetical protein [Deltaproteobacteria bacterium]
MKRISMRNYLGYFITMMLLLGATGCVSARNSVSYPALQTDGSMIVKGKGVKILVAEGILKIKPPKGDAVVVKLTKETIFKNIGSAAEIKKYQPLEVIYVVKGAENIAISVKIIAEGSC